MPLWYLSFAGDEGWRGAAVVEAVSNKGAIREAWRRGVNPGGSVMLLGPLPKDLFELFSPHVNRLFTTIEELDMAGIGPTKEGKA